MLMTTMRKLKERCERCGKNLYAYRDENKICEGYMVERVWCGACGRWVCVRGVKEEKRGNR